MEKPESNPTTENPEQGKPEPEQSPAAAQPTVDPAEHNRLAAQLRKAQKAQADLQAKLERLAEEKKTEEEKAIDEAYKRGKSETEAAILKVRIEGRAEAAMARFGIPSELLPAVMSELGEIDDPAEVPGAVEKLTKEKPAVYGVYSAPAKPKPLSGAPAHATSDTTLDGMITREQIQQAVDRAGGVLDSETIKKLHAASRDNRLVG